MDNVRKAVVSGLMQVENNGYSNLILNNVLQNIGTDDPGRSFAVHLFYGTIERQYTLDASLNRFLKKPVEKMDADVRNILRSGLYQIHFMNSVPTAAAVNEAVNLCKAFKKKSASGLVNAVLRNAAKSGLVNVFSSEVERLHIQYSVSIPIVELLMQQYSDETEDILKSFFVQPKLVIRVNTLKMTQENLRKEFSNMQIETEQGRIENSLIVHYKKDITKLALFQDGYFHVQGEASQACVYAVHAKEGMKIIDLCSAPGGKSATMAEYMNNTGVLMCADKSRGRLTLTEKLLNRLGIKNASVEEWAAEEFHAEFENANVVLCDVPCSGLGTIAKKPDIRFKELENIKELYQLQSTILQTAASYVVEHGRLVYSTCTINQKENEEVIAHFLKNNANYKILHEKLPIDGAIYTEFGTVLLPNRTETDGFFIATMERMW